MKIGVQLYSLRNSLKNEKGYETAFARLKNMGAEVVQVSGRLNIDSRRLGELSREYGLPVCISHVPFGRLEEEPEQLIREHKDFGCCNMGIGMMPAKYRTGKLKDIDLFVKFLNDTAKLLKKEGMTLSYHNHWFEFDRTEGHVVMDYLIENTSPQVMFIPDTFWIKVGGYAPEEYISKAAGRINTVHLKDYCKILGIPVFRAVGKGNLDFRSILDASQKAGAENAVIELDKSPSPYRSVGFGLNYINKLQIT